MSKTVHVILQRDVAKLGKGGEVVKVASGYARNYLLPEGFALSASVGNLARVAHNKNVAREKAAKKRSDAAALATKLGTLELTIARTVGGEGKLYGSVTHKDIEAALKARATTSTARSCRWTTSARPGPTPSPPSSPRRSPRPSR